MSHGPSRWIAAVSLMTTGALAAFAYDPPAGVSLFPLLGSAQALAYGPSVTALDAPWADRENPAASADQQRLVVDAGFTALTDFGIAGNGGQGLGGAGSLGLSIPEPYGVWSASAEMVDTPSTMTALPIGQVASFRGGIAKDIYANFYVGGALDLAAGDKGWGAGLDLGAMQLLGDWGLLKDLHWGLVLSGIGKSYSDAVDPITLSGGLRANLLRTKDWRIALGVDLSSPSFQDLGFGLSTGISYRGIVTFRANWDQDMRELAMGGDRSLLPSLGLMADIPLSRTAAPDSLLAKEGWDQGEIQPAVASAPLYGGVWALGGGVTMPLGVINRDPPRIAAAFPFSKWGPAYISPNNDGIQDSLEIPVGITDRRYVVGWTLSIANDKGEVIRKISNKESRPETEGLTGLIARLGYVKKGVSIPAKLVWNGVTDSGQVAPDGVYSARIEAVDDNGNKQSVGPFPIVVDDSPPKVQIAVPEDPPIFSPDLGNEKNTLSIKLSGSVEDLWSAQVTDASGRAVRTLRFENAAPSDWVWDGKEDDGTLAPDGVYSFAISSTDRAGNSVSSRFDNIIVNTQQPAIGLAVDLAAFSPGGDGVKDRVDFFPRVGAKSGIVGWKLAVIDKGGREVWSLSGKDGSALKDSLPFDGRDPLTSRIMPEGSYRGRLSVAYLNGYSAAALSPSFVLDVTPPSGSVSSDRPAFNPAGAEGQDRVHFLETGDKSAAWVGEVSASDGRVVRSFSFSPLPSADVEWDGTDDAGKPLPDGRYSYRLKALDAAGNSFASPPASVSIDTAKKAARLSADFKAFSPLPDSPKPRLTLTAQVLANDKVRSYELTIVGLDANGQPSGPALRSWKGDQSVPASFVWDGSGDTGSIVPDGRYAARLTVSYLNGDAADSTVSDLVVDTIAPSIEVSAAPLLFSPAASSRIRAVRFSQKSVPGDDWTGALTGPDGKQVRRWAWKGQASDFEWNGTDEAGNTVPDGAYHYEVTSVDEAGNRGSGRVPSIVVDQRQVQVFVTASEPGISPNGDGYKDTETFSLIVKLREGIDAWHFAVVDKDGVERSVYGGKGDDVPSRIIWDGRDSSGAVVDGYYTGFFSVDYVKGDHAEARTGRILVDTEAPKAQVSLTPELFSPDNDGYNDELTVALEASSVSGIAEWRFEVSEQATIEGAVPGTPPVLRPFKSWGGTGAPAASLAWDGRSDKGELVQSATDYPFVFSVRDALGNAARVEGAISVDILVIRDGDRLRIDVPSIEFGPKSADFAALDAGALANNARVVRRIAQIVNTYKDYNILVEDHMNSASKIGGDDPAAIADEEANVLIPLTTGRAGLLKGLLIADGVNPSRLEAKGMGSSGPVVDIMDAQDRWKNDRVELVLTKGQAAAPAMGQ